MTSIFTSSALIGGLISEAAVAEATGGLTSEAATLFLGTGDELPEGVALFPAPPGPSSHDEVEDPDSSSEDKVGGWSPLRVDLLYSVTNLSN